MQIFNILLGLLGMALAGPATESYKDQFCTDPRTMRKHPAYSEWADAYSCSRHRCQPGGRNLAIYTVGCKRVEAPESAIECEEVVEDTNMQFPYCCTRLRCLVVVRGEVWTRVLGQPWETLPAAPWSHMYKMKKPPPTDGTFLPKSPGDGPVYELQTEADSKRDQVLRASKKGAAEGPDCNDVVPRAAPTPDIVIALSTNSDVKALKKNDRRHKRGRKAHFKSRYFDDEAVEPRNEEHEETSTDKPLTPSSEERFDANAYEVTQTPLKSQPQVSWTEIPKNQLNEHEPSMDAETLHTEREQEHEPTSYIQPEPLPEEKKPTNLQALVDAIGTRMRDIENVVQRMSEKVKPPSNDADIASAEKRSLPDTEIQTQKHHSKERKEGRTKKPNFDGDNYKRFTKHGSKYIHGAPDGSTEQPLFVEDSNLNGYYSDASNSMLRRASPPKEPAATYMAPVDTRRNTPAHISIATDFSEEEKREKKHTHTKKKQHVHHKKHHSKDKRKRLNRLNSVELDKNVVSIEDSGASQ